MMSLPRPAGRLVAMIAGLFFSSMGCQLVAIEPGRLWVYAPANLQVESEVDRIETLIRRAAKAGFNGIAITDYKFGNFKDRPEHFFENMKRIGKVASEVDVELVPCVIPVGYSSSILQNDPNLAAGLPVKDCRFVVRGGKAIVEAENVIPFGDFEEASKNGPAGWDFVDGWQVSSSLDSGEAKRGKSCLKLTRFREGQDAGNARLMKSVEVKPFHQYRFTFWSRSSELDADIVQFLAMGDGKRLSYTEFETRADQEWTKRTIVFNTFQHTEIMLYLGVWAGNSGTIWIDDARLEIVGGVNLLRREGCPVEVKSEATGLVYEEGRDYERWEDPKLGRVPYAGEYSADHDAPAIVISKDSRIKSDEVLSVSFYHTVIIHSRQVGCSLVAERLYDLYQDQLDAINKEWSPSTYFFQHDEIRVAGHDQLANGRPSGELLKQNVRRCIDVAAKVSPNAEVVVWSDMFDPNHNAVDNYYLTAGTMKGSWNGLHSNITIMNWNNNKSRKSLKWFTGRSHSQIISAYYDDDVRANFDRWTEAISEDDDIRGWMYTTWEKNYDDLETFAKLVKEYATR